MSASSTNPKRIIIAAAFAAFLATFNETFLNVGFAPIMAGLAVDVSTVQWLATAYMLGAAVMVPVSAFAYRSIPTRPLFCATTALLVIGSVIGALAPNFAVLLAGRIIQALGTGMLIPIGMNITFEAAPRDKLGTYMGIMGAMTTLGPSSSVIVAGLLLAFLPWQALLWTFGALSLLCLIVGAALLGDIAKLTKPRLDAPSVALVGIALIGILYAVSTAFGGNVVVAIAAFIVGCLCMWLFVRRQGRIENPLINLQPLHVPAFALGVAINMIALIVMFAMNIIIPTFMQSVLGTNPLAASLTLFPAILLSCIVSPLAGRIYDRAGIGVLLPLGFALVCVFSAALSWLIGIGSTILLAILYIPVICGCALVIGPVQSFALSQLEPQMNPHGVTVMSTGFQIAGCLGSSVFTGVYAAFLAAQTAGGATLQQAGSAGFLAAGLLAALASLAGFFCTLKEAAFERKAKAAAARGAIAEDSRSFALAAVMKKEVYAVLHDDSVATALQLFVEKGISGAPVLDATGRLCGFVSDGDIMRFLANQHSDFKNAYSFALELENENTDEKLAQLMALPVKQIATPNAVGIEITADLGKLAALFSQHHYKKLPVLQDGVMVGIVNRSNITRHLVAMYLQATA